MEQRKTVSLDSKLYEKIKNYCDKHDLKIAKFIERTLSQYIENLERKHGKM